MARIFDGRLPVHYGQAYVESSENPCESLEDCFVDQTNGLCGGAKAGCLFLITGLHTGQVGLTVDVLDSPPTIDDDIWEEIVEVSFTPGKGKVVLTEWGGECICEIPLKLKSYRVRYCGRNMDRGTEIDTDTEGEPVDFYSLAFWPSSTAPDIIVKQTSNAAAYWHNWAQTFKI